MNRWRAKRRYEANRRFGEHADEALVAISILKANRDGIDLDQSEESLRAKLDRADTSLRGSVTHSIGTPMPIHMS